MHGLWEELHECNHHPVVVLFLSFSSFSSFRETKRRRDNTIIITQRKEGGRTTAGQMRQEETCKLQQTRKGVIYVITFFHVINLPLFSLQGLSLSSCLTNEGKFCTSHIFFFMRDSMQSQPFSLTYSSVCSAFFFFFETKMAFNVSWNETESSSSHFPFSLLVNSKVTS